MAQDILEKGAILQRDGETYAIAPHIPGGITTPEQLRRIADAAERFGAAALKITSAQRIAIIGIRPEDLDAAWEAVGEQPGMAIGLCVRSVKVCPGTTYCKRGRQDSVALGLELDRRYHGRELPWKFKMGVSGCPIDCAEVCIKDVGLIGTPKGWKVMAGGNGGPMPHLAQPLVDNVASADEAMEIVERVVRWFERQGKRARLGKILEQVGFEAFRDEVLGG
ncbi:NAD(P)/FAD-dependent oxidoreductase [Deferrisoma palaeochoriense]